MTKKNEWEKTHRICRYQETDQLYADANQWYIWP
jgi:hypothetical protein